MRFLIDTNLLLWARAEPHRLSPAAGSILTNPEHELHFSVVTIWEVAIKSNLRRRDFTFNPSVLRRDLLDNGYEELPITSDHALATSNLPFVHGDPFDRMLIAQAMSEGITLLTADRTISEYPGPIRLV